MTQPKSEVTRILNAWNDGDPDALSRLMPLVIEDLRAVARKHLGREAPGHTLQPTALVNEVYLRLVGRRTVQWRNRAQFFGFFAELIRHVLVDYARSRQSARRGKGPAKVPLTEVLDLPNSIDPELVALDDALQSLEQIDPRQSRIVVMRFFAGLTVDEISEVLGISPRTIKRDWQIAKLWLYQELYKH